jgi:UPF0716 family protein affecting phage T7 exclusion
VICLMLVVLAALIIGIALTRNHGLADLATLGALLVLSAVLGRFLVRDLRRHPANFPEAAPSHGLRMTVTAADGSRAPSRWT